MTELSAFFVFLPDVVLFIVLVLIYCTAGQSDRFSIEVGRPVGANAAFGP